MIDINCISISYRNAPVQIREQFACIGSEREAVCSELFQAELVTECVVLSTCNRTELYYIARKDNFAQIEKLLSQYKQVSYGLTKKYCNIFCKEKAILHLYKVACGMDSMLLGEDEILSQLKEAFFYARDLGRTGYYLNTMFQDAITCAKEIKTQTKLSKIPVSIGTLVANEVMKWKQSEKKVLILGISGKMGSIVMKNLCGRTGITVYGSSRRHNAMVQIIEPGVIPVDYHERYQVMEDADIIISVTSSPHYTIRYEELRTKLITKKERLFLDLSVPMDIDKEITAIEGITLYDIDYFEHLSIENNEMKRNELRFAQDIMEQYISNMKKAVEFHCFLECMPRVKKTLNEKPLEKLLYQLREKTTCEEFTVLLDALRKI